MSDSRSKALRYAQENQSKFLSELNELIRIPSVSTEDNKKEDMEKAAEWIASKMRQIGLDNVGVYPTGGHPAVYGECLNAPQAPTVLVYGHYDVQPPDPVDLWESDPFEPVQKGENLYARGASDMKGQIIISLAAVESILKQDEFPVNVKFIVEGEEEIGSPNLENFIGSHQELLSCDVALNPDTGMISATIPTITYGLRGLAYFELKVFGPEHDLHSGLFGGIVHNPAQVMADLIAGMHDKNGRVTLPGFYNRVRILSEDERRELARLPLSEKEYIRQTGVSELWEGEKGYTAVERLGARPTLEINGLYSGFIDPGSKTVIPSYAMAKISTRLVPDQNPEETYQQLLEYLRENVPSTVRWEVIEMAGGPACLTDPQLPATQALAQSLETVFGEKPVYKLEGGSVPVTSTMEDILGVKSVLTGFGLPDDNIHAPNEKLHLPTFYKGIDTLIHFFYNMRNINYD